MQRASAAIGVGLAAVMLAAIGTGEAPRALASSPAEAAKLRIQEGYGRLPLRFERNEGQADERARYLARGPGYTMFITPTSMVLSLRREGGKRKDLEPLRLPEGRPQSFDQAVLRVKLLRSRPGAKVEGLEELPGKSNYFIGNDPKKWRTDIASYARVECRGVYLGIDLAYHGSGRELEYDFLVAPGGDPSRIRLRFEGMRGLRVDGEGDLVVTLQGGEVVKRAPRAYQEGGTSQRPVRAQWVLLGKNEAGFAVGAYDRTRALVIDPVLSYSTYLGGNTYGDDGYAIAVDGSGSAYVTGYTASTDFPTQNPYQADRLAPDAFVTKLSPSGNSLVYSTYLGGNFIEGGTPYGFDEGTGIAVDSSGSAYVTGVTNSVDFPTQNPYQTARPGARNDAFVTKLSPSGSSLVYSTYLGGTGGPNSNDAAYEIAVDSSGSAYVTGTTFSTDFPTQNPFQMDQGLQDAFVTKFSPAGNTLVYSTYLGGNSTDYSTSIAVDSSGSAYVAGYTGSIDFPTQNPYHQTNQNGDAFVTKLSPAGNTLVYSTYLGGLNQDYAWAIAVDGAGSAYVTGETASSDFPTQNPYQTDRPFSDGFVTKLSPAGNSLVYSTYLGGDSDGERGVAIAVDALGSAYVTGWTYSTDFPTQNPYQATCGDCSYVNAFVTQLSPAGNTLVYSTYLGGNLNDLGQGIAVDGSGSAYVTGSTTSTDFPTLNPYQGELLDVYGNVFVTKFGLPPPPLNFFTITPCRLIDTRNPAGPYGQPALAAGATRNFTLAGQCGIALTAKSISVNIAVTNPTAAGNLRLYLAGGGVPQVSAINYSAGQTRTNNAIVPLSAGALAVYCAQASGNTTDFILDANGYFE